MTKDILLSVRDLTVALGDRSIIRNLSFNVAMGDTLAIIGPNGSGKTVLLKALLGLVPYVGSIAWSPGTRLGYVPQKIAADRQPTASLDEIEEERIYELLEQLQNKQKLTLLLVSHDLNVVHRSATMVLCLSKGKPCIGPPQEMLTPERLEATYSMPHKYYHHAQSHQEAGKSFKRGCGDPF